MRPHGFKRPCPKSIFLPSIFCRYLSRTAGPLRRRKHVLVKTWKCSTNWPNPRSHSCASSHVLVFPLNTGSLFFLLKSYHLETGLFWDAMGSFACLFDVFYYISTSESTAKLTNSTISDSGLDPENHKHASYKKEAWNPYEETYTRTKPHWQKRVDLKKLGGWMYWYIYMWTHLVKYWYFPGGTAPWSDWNHSCIRTVSYMTWHDIYPRTVPYIKWLILQERSHDSCIRQVAYVTWLRPQNSALCDMTHLENCAFREVTWHNSFLIPHMWIYISHHKWTYHSIWLDVWMIPSWDVYRRSQLLQHNGVIWSMIDEVNYCGTMGSFVVRSTKSIIAAQWSHLQYDICMCGSMHSYSTMYWWY